ncbi:MAG: hypothetical protein E5V96_00915 [Mesorhizobium sp.]|nr:MAG: hypothetical protein E5V96_00915 [Mesorhizobium sp.]
MGPAYQRSAGLWAQPTDDVAGTIAVRRHAGLAHGLHQPFFGIDNRRGESGTINPACFHGTKTRQRPNVAQKTVEVQEGANIT